MIMTKHFRLKLNKSLLFEMFAGRYKSILMYSGTCPYSHLNNPGHLPIAATLLITITLLSCIRQSVRKMLSKGMHGIGGEESTMHADDSM